MPAITRAGMLKLLTTRLSEDRFAHSIAVEKEAIKLASHHGEDWHKAALAGLLHDVCRCDDQSWQLAYMRENSLCLSKEWLQNPQLWHGPCAAALIRREFGIRDQKILMAVRYHTTGRPGMTDFEKIVFLADKIEENRDFDGVEELRAAAYRSLDEALYLALRQSLSLLCKTGLPIVKEAYQAYNELAITLKQKG